MISIAEALGFKEECNKWYVYCIPHPSDEKKKPFIEMGMQVYMPKLFNYVFVLATRKQVDALIMLDHIYPIYNHRVKGEILSSSKTWLTVPTHQMHALMQAIENQEEIDIVAPEEYQLEKGDKVLVTAGSFAGLEGVLLTSQGSRGGKIYVGITNTEGFLTAMIPDEYLKVIEFSRSNDHFYRRIEACEKVLEESLETLKQDKILKKEQRAYLQFFLERFDSLTNLTHVNHARLVACRFAALSLLGKHDEAESCIRQFEAETAQSKSKRRSAKRSPSAQKYINKWVTIIDNKKIIE